jgi:hypothetical protein
MEAIVHNTTSAYATRLRLRVPRFAGMPAWSGTAITPSRPAGRAVARDADAGGQGVGIRFSQREGTYRRAAPEVENRGAQKAPGFFVAWRHNK